MRNAFDSKSFCGFFGTVYGVIQTQVCGVCVELEWLFVDLVFYGVCFFNASHGTHTHWLRFTTKKYRFLSRVV